MRQYRLRRQKRRPSISLEPRPQASSAEPNAQKHRKASTSEKWGKGLHKPSTHPNRPSSPHSSLGDDNSTLEEPKDWKPSVYWVLLCLFIMSAGMMFGSAALFRKMEGWSYVEGLYFAFVSYATIGLGDFVALQEKDYGKWETLYRIVAFVTMVFGCCCIYSLLNVTSIVIKQRLNWLIKKMNYGSCCCCCCRCSAATTIGRRFSTKRRKKRSGRNNNYGHHRSMRASSMNISVLNVGNHGGRGGDRVVHYHNEESANTAPGSPSFDDERRYSGENMISIRGELNNKVSLAVMQKRLYESAQLSRSCSYYHYSHYDQDGSTLSANSVGPLAIVSEKLGETNG